MGEQNVESFALLSVVADNDAGAANNLSRVSLAIDLAKTSPGAQSLGVGDLKQVDLVLGAESLDQLDVLGLGAGLDKHA